MTAVYEPGRLLQGRDGVFRLKNEVFSSNTYVCQLNDSGSCVLIDPGLDTIAISNFLTERKLVPRAVLCTHGHFDHIGSASHFQQAFGAAVYLHQADVKLSRSANFLLMAAKVEARITIPQVDVALQDKDVVVIDSATFTFHSLPGHTPGSCVIAYQNALFTGDTLYRSGTDLNSLPGENPDDLRRSILRLAAEMPPESWVYPGHGGSASLGQIMDGNIELRRFLGLDGQSA